MEHEPVPVGPTAAVAQAVRRLRKERGMSADDLAGQMSRIGFKWSRMVVVKLETGRRDEVSVAELLGLAYVLDTTPYELVVPADDDTPYQVLPTRQEPAGRVRAWMRGTSSLDAERSRDTRYLVTRMAEHIPPDVLAEILASVGEDDDER